MLPSAAIHDLSERPLAVVDVTVSLAATALHQPLQQYDTVFCMQDYKAHGSGATGSLPGSRQAPQPLFVRSLGPMRAMRSRLGVPLPIRRVRVFCQVRLLITSTAPAKGTSLLL